MQDIAARRNCSADTQYDGIVCEDRKKTVGPHHVTAITANVQANVDFYPGVPGLRLVKQAAGFSNAEQLHLFYGDKAGNPESIVTLMVWEDGARRRTGRGQAYEIGFSVPPDSIGDWLALALAAQVPVEGPARDTAGVAWRRNRGSRQPLVSPLSRDLFRSGRSVIKGRSIRGVHREGNAQLWSGSGANDPFARLAPALGAALRTGGATLDARMIKAGHDVGATGLELARNWLHVLQSGLPDGS